MESNNVKYLVGGRIRSARELAGMTQKELAKSPGVNSSSQQIGKYELGHQDMTIAKLYRIAAALKVEPRSLLP